MADAAQDPWASVASPAPVAPTTTPDPWAAVASPAPAVQPQIPDTANIEKTAQNNISAQDNTTPQTPVKILTTALGYNPIAPYKQGDVLPQPVRQHINDCYANGTATTAADCMQSTVPQVASSIYGTAAREFAIDQPSNIAGIAGGVAGGAAIAPLAAGVAAISGPAAPITGTAVELAGVLGGATLGSAAIQKGMNKLQDEFPDVFNKIGIGKEQLAADQSQHPTVKFWSGLVSNLPYFTPQLATKAKMLINGAIGAAQEGGREWSDNEKLDWTKILGSAGVMAVSNKESSLGSKITSGASYLSSRISSGYEAMKKPVADQNNVPPDQVTNDHIDSAISEAHPHDIHPDAVDYDHAATVMFGEDGADKGAKLLRDINSATGVRPEQVFDDARNSTDVANDLRNGVIPSAYDHLIVNPPAAESTGLNAQKITDDLPADHPDAPYIKQEDTQKGAATKEYVNPILKYIADRGGVVIGTEAHTMLRSALGADFKTGGKGIPVGLIKGDKEGGKVKGQASLDNIPVTTFNDQFDTHYAGDEHGNMKPEDIIEAVRNESSNKGKPSEGDKQAEEENRFNELKNDVFDQAAELGAKDLTNKEVEDMAHEAHSSDRPFEYILQEQLAKRPVVQEPRPEAAPQADKPVENPEPKTIEQLVNPDFAKEDKALPSLFGKLSKAISDMISVNPSVRAETKNLSDLGKLAEDDPVMAGKIAARYIHETLSPDSVSDTAEATATILKEHLGVAARETAIAQNALNRVWRSAGKLVGAQKDAFIDYMQNRSNGATIDPALQETADVVRKINQDIEAKLQALPGNEQRAFIKDYFTQNWKDTAISRRVMNEAIARQGSGRNLEQRIIPSHAEGVALGLEDKFDHPLETVMNYVKNVQKYIVHVEAVNDMIGGGMAKRFKGDEDTTGYTKLDGTVGSDNGEGSVYAQDDAARIYNNAISKGFEGTAGEIFKAINFSSNVSRRMKLGLLNLFHAGVITQASMSSEFGLGTKEITGALDKDNPQSAGLSIIKGAARMSLSTLAPFKHLMEGGKGLEEYKNPGSSDPRTQQIIDVLSRANAITSSMPEYMKSGAQVDLWDGWKRGDFDNFADKASDFVNNLTLKNAGVKIPKLMFQTVARAMDTTVKPLFDWYTPRMKTGAAMEAMGQFMDTHPNATHEEQLQAASAIGDSIDNRMGEMMTQNLFLNKKLEQSINQGFLSYGWVLGQLRGGIGGAKDIAMFKNTPNAQYIIGTVATTALLNTLYQYLHTDKPPQDLKDLMAPKTGGIQNAGGEVVPEREFGPSHESQWYHYSNDFTGELFGNESNPLIPFVKMLATGKNWADQDVTDRNDPKAMDYIRAMGDQMEPIMISTLEKGAKKGSHLTMAERALGFRQVPAFVANPEGVKEQTEERNERNWEKAQKFDQKQKDSYEQ